MIYELEQMTIEQLQDLRYLNCNDRYLVDLISDVIKLKIHKEHHEKNGMSDFIPPHFYNKYL